MEKREENKHLQLLDVLGIPLAKNYKETENIIFSHKDKSLIYPLGSNIILYNLEKNSKTFLQYFSSNILCIKYIQYDFNILIIISDNNPFPILSIWKVPSFQGLFSQELVLKNNFEIENIYIEKINSYTLIILIINKNEAEHYLYVLNILNNLKFEITFFGKIKNILPQIIGFGSFYRNNEIVFLMKHNLQIYSLDIFKNKNTLKKNVNFSFQLKANSLKVSKISNFLCILTEKGNCLIYDNNGINTSNINPIGIDIFISCQFCENCLCLGTTNGNIFVYNIYGFILKYMIKYEHIVTIKNFSLIIKMSNRCPNEDKIIIQASVDEKSDQLFCLFQNKSFFFLSLNQLLDETKFRYNIKPEKLNAISFYSFNQVNKILDICLKSYNNLNFEQHRIQENSFYTCGLDNKLIFYNIQPGTDKIKNLYYDLNHILSLSKSTNNSTHYITSITLHPIYTHKLYLGDNKGFLYIIYLNTDIINKHKKYSIDSFSIIYLSFSQNGNLLFIGLETGKQLIYRTNKSLECMVKLTYNYLSYDEIYFRKNNNHIISYGYFFENKNHRHCFIYKKNNFILEYDKLFKDENGSMIIKKKIMDIIFNYPILDIVMHKSENYVIVLDTQKQILINNINENKITAIIDLKSQINKIYNIQIDNSGLYLAIICDIKLKNYNQCPKYKNDLLVIEVNTSKVKNCFIQNSSMSKAVFDNEGKYLIIGGESGEISLWRLPGDISSNIKNLLGEIKFNENFWDKYEIKYGKFLPYYKDIESNDDFTLTSYKINFADNSNLSKVSNISNINKNFKGKNGIEESNDNSYSNINFDLDEYKNKRKKRESKSMTMKINNPKYNSRNYGRNDGYQNTLGNYNMKVINYKENGIPKMNLNYKNNIELSNSFNYFKDGKNIRNNNRYNFWSKNDTIKIKKSINSNGCNKYPEPNDIDDYLFD